MKAARAAFVFLYWVAGNPPSARLGSRENGLALSYSCRRASSGSIREAFHAGTRQAIAATTSITTQYQNDGLRETSCSMGPGNGGAGACPNARTGVSNASNEAKVVRMGIPLPGNVFIPGDAHKRTAS